MSGFLLQVFVLSILFQTANALPLTDREEEHPSARPLYHVSVLGAPATGPLIDGVVGSVQKGCRHRFFCYSSAPAQGFLGPQAIAEPLSIRDQPGVFPAPIRGSAALTFCFNCSKSESSFTPLIVRPDGTKIHGQPMNAATSPQTIVIASPAQTGIYTLFILTHQKENQAAQAVVEASISTQPKEGQTLLLHSFDSIHPDSDLISAEFIYIPQK